MSKLKIVEKNFDLKKLVKFHTVMAAIALIFVFVHYPLLRLARTAWELTERIQVSTGNVGMLSFLTLMLLAFIFMNNRLIKNRKVWRLRTIAFKMKFKFNINKALHNLTLLTVFIALYHTLLSFTSKSSVIMRGGYIFFFGITLISWIYHKLIRRIRSESDPFIHRKALWDTVTSEITTEPRISFTLKLLEKNPLLYPCFQCGVCTESCPVANATKGKYNPRDLILKVLQGLEEDIFGQENAFTIWGCTVCDTCDEVCPQKGMPLEIFTTLKNMSTERGEAPPHYYTQVKTVLEHGKAIPMQPAIERRRQELDLPSILEPNMDEIQKLLSSTKVQNILSTR
jgi:heterodisulfide reductase subunit C